MMLNEAPLPRHRSRHEAHDLPCAKIAGPTDTERALQDIACVARSGHALFIELASRTSETEVRDAFAYVADVKKRLLESLAPWTPPALSDCAAGSIAAATEKLHRDISRKFRSDAPVSVAHALTFGEDQLVKLTERAFEATRVPALQQMLKSYYAELSICQQAMSRLQTHVAR